MNPAATQHLHVSVSDLHSLQQEDGEASGLRIHRVWARTRHALWVSTVGEASLRPCRVVLKFISFTLMNMRVAAPPAHRHALQSACLIAHLVVVWCVCLCLMRVIIWLIVWLEGTKKCLSFVNLNIFACQRAHCLLTVRHCSSVEEQLSRLDRIGKHKVRLVIKHWMGFSFTRIVWRAVWKPILCMIRHWACFCQSFSAGLQPWSWWD